MKLALLLLAVASAGFLAGVIWAALGQISREADSTSRDIWEDLH